MSFSINHIGKSVKDKDLTPLFADGSITENEDWKAYCGSADQVRAGLVKPASKLQSLIDENNQLIAIFVKSVSTAKDNQKKTS